MNKIQEIESTIKELEEKVHALDLGSMDEHTLEIVRLLKTRTDLLKDLFRLQWEQKSMLERHQFRKEDLSTTFHYMKKYEEEVKDQWQYKKTYIEMTEQLETILQRDFGDINILFKIIHAELASAKYLNIQKNVSLKICFQMLSDRRMEEAVVNDLLHNYALLNALECPLKGLSIF
ncbi:hypothetical protein CLV59_10799 [Chitinophaga dinghuensis]|uniref:Uncharacterized protein n=1 Tax=Chitinophaga dinghuensis TaxID=1539050 RepID=A0A327VZW5_9BACT|nr:hypothetical protein [Chitinophaga dinghuensis]RAJ77332.1 hypothetical protein CLV59_10799 [Chitinophaga dinghuensis]